MRRFLSILALLILCRAAVAQRPQQSPVNQWPNYQYNSNFSPLTQVTSANVARLTRACTCNHGARSRASANRGVLDVYKDVASDLVREIRRDTFTVPNPVTVYKNLIIGSARPGEGLPPQPRGDIRAWDAITGKLVWSFHVVPQPGEPNHEDWTADTWKDRSGANVWSTMVVAEH